MIKVILIPEEQHGKTGRIVSNENKMAEMMQNLAKEALEAFSERYPEDRIGRLTEIMNVLAEIGKKREAIGLLYDMAEMMGDISLMIKTWMLLSSQENVISCFLDRFMQCSEEIYKFMQEDDDE